MAKGLPCIGVWLILGWMTALKFAQLGWVGRERARAYAIILLISSLISMPVIFAEAVLPGGSDFIAFWSAARIAAAGASEQAYDPVVLGKVQSLVGAANVVPFVHPPQFLAWIAPLGGLSYPVAWIAWVAITYVLWVAINGGLAPRFKWVVAAYPGALLAAWHAQTGLLTSTFQAGAARLLQHRPFAAGMCIGLLVIKPHLALLFPIGLLASRNWPAIAGACISIAATTVLTIALFGIEVFRVYPDAWEISSRLMAEGGDKFFLRQVTVFAMVRVWAPTTVATIVQIVVTATVALWTWRVWSGAGDLGGKLAFLFAATPLATPYLFSYDLPFLLLPVVWLAGRCRTDWSRPILLGLYVAPLVCRAVALPLWLNPMPLASAAMTILVAQHLTSKTAMTAP